MNRLVVSPLVPSLAILYVCFAALGATGGALHTYFMLVVLPLAVVFVWRKTRPAPEGDDPIVAGARVATRACLWGATLWVAARSGPPGRASFDVAANLGTGTAAVAALVALARIPGLPGLLVPHPATRALDAAAFAAFAWGIAIAIPATDALAPAGFVSIDPLAIDYATTTASAAGLLVLAAACVRLLQLRRLELGVGERARAALALSLAALLFVVPASLFGVTAPDRLLPFGLIIASIGCLWAATAANPARIARALRASVAVGMLGAPLALATALLAREWPAQAGLFVLLASLSGVFVGLVARAVARPLGPEQSRWLEAIEAATERALVPEPDAALRAALEALGRALARPVARPVLYRTDPAEAVSVDVAGYLHVDRGAAPEGCYELALGEPELTLRAEVLQALEVRRPDVRGLLEWMRDVGAFSATRLDTPEGPIGLLVLPRGSRTAPLTLEEARSLRGLAERLTAVLSLASALARSRQREAELREELNQRGAEIVRLEQVALLSNDRHSRIADRLAQRVSRASYSPAVRVALDRAAQLASRASRVALIAPFGTDVLGWAAIMHRASSRSGGPLVWVEGASGREHDVELWADAQRSPLALAEGGSLVLLDAGALPLPLQDRIAVELGERARRAESSAIPAAGLVLGVHEQPEALVAAQRLSRSLERLVAQNLLELPRLADRAEDLRAIVLDELAKLGMRLRGRPLGIDAPALRALAEHAFPGNELELEHLLGRAAAAASGEVVTLADLHALGFEVEPFEDDRTTPLPPLARNRRTLPRSR
jgi:transcriptional regulator with AAA-type ATPase domain